MKTTFGASSFVVLAFFAGASMVNADPSQQDNEFITGAGSGGMLEVRLGQYAANNAGSDEVKKFGERMAGDHFKANTKLKALATQQPIELPKALNDEDQKALDRLEKLHGSEFDKAYLKYMVEDHEKDIAAFEKEISAGSDPLVKAFAEEILPTLQHHLEMAKNLSSRLSP
jgi:putative membrane protein